MCKYIFLFLYLYKYMNICTNLPVNTCMCVCVCVCPPSFAYLLLASSLMECPVFLKVLLSLLCREHVSTETGLNLSFLLVSSFFFFFFFFLQSSLGQYLIPSKKKERKKISLLLFYVHRCFHTWEHAHMHCAETRLTRYCCWRREMPHVIVTIRTFTLNYTHTHTHTKVMINLVERYVSECRHVSKTGR